MQPGKPSRTAWGAACHRAAHQVLEHGRIFADPLAMRILGEGAAGEIREAGKDPSRRRLRLFIAVRARFAEDALAAAVARGLRQVVVLGAGLDTYAYRAAPGDGLRVFEVDHPATQAWKRRLLAGAAIEVPGCLSFVPVDFEREGLADALAGAGFDRGKPAFFTWLGVVPYLAQPAVLSTLGFVAGLPGGAHVAFDYGNPPEPDAGPGDCAPARRELAARVASAGEELKCHFETRALHAALRDLGFREIEDLGPEQILRRYLGIQKGHPGDRGGHVVRATTL